MLEFDIVSFGRLNSLRLTADEAVTLVTDSLKTSVLSET